MTLHTPVLLKEVIEHLNVRSNKNYIDATFGGGGYTREILACNKPNGVVLALDLNPQAFSTYIDDVNGAVPEAGAGIPEPPTVSGFGDALQNGRLMLAQGNFASLAEITHRHSVGDIAGVVFDLGLSSDLLERSGRGFSFQRNEPLIISYQLPVRMGIRPGGPVTSYYGTAKEVVNEYSRDKLEHILQEYGEIRQARSIAEGIAKARKEQRIETTVDLRNAVEKSVKSATPKLLAQVWQALRIEVNDELANLKKGLAGAWEVLDSGGRIVVVSFHSLEDRIVKRFFKEKSHNSADILTKKPVRPRKEEVKRNSKARSAKLRAIEKL